MISYLRKYGMRAFFFAAFRRLRTYFNAIKRRRGYGALKFQFTCEPISFVRSQIAKPDTVSLLASPNRTVNWVIPPFYRGSGGHMTIFRIAQNLERHGFEQNFYIFGQSEYGSDAEATESLRTFFFPLKGSVFLDVRSMRDADICVATSWETAYAVRDFTGARRKLYFVQDYEPGFFAAGSEQVLAEETYRFGFECICAGKWLAQKMSEFGARSSYFDLAYDPVVYRPQPVQPRKRLAFYARPSTPRRGFELGLLAIAQALKIHPDLEIVTFGMTHLPRGVSLPIQNKGILSESQLANLYSSSAVGLSLSLTNYSLIPQEMLACGLPVVELNLPSQKAAYESASGTPRFSGIYLAEPTPQAIAAQIDEILRLNAKDQLMARQSARDAVTHLSWEKAGRAVLKVFLES